jgi:uncharacterized metal-binding protein
MPSGRTHDRLAWWSSIALLLIIGALWRWDLAFWAGAGSLFGGLMFSGDLDTVSRPLKRWGWLRWLWWPYRKLVPHRHSHSHGLIWGPVFRMAYLGVLAFLLAIGLQAGLQMAGWSGVAGDVKRMTGQAAAGLAGLPQAGVAMAVIGVLVGNAVHSLADWVATGAKRMRSRRRS